MDSSERSDVIKDLTKAFAGYAHIQVVTLDWNKAAEDGLITQDAQWTPAVGAWAARQLMAAGFAPANIHIAGWSHGSYVAYSLAQQVQKISAQIGLPADQQHINALVALDPAGNWPLLSGYDHKAIDFRKVSRNAIAIEGSWIAGADALAAQADVSYKLHHLNTLATQIRTEHASPVTAFAAILEHERTAPGAFSQYLSLANIMNPNLRASDFQENAYGAYEFIMDVSVQLREGDEGTYPYAIPVQMQRKQIDGGEDCITMNTFG